MSRRLLEDFAKAADGYSRDAVICAAANLILNALRQSHPHKEGAEDELDCLAQDMKMALGREHYTKDGTRNGLIILGQKVKDWLRWEGVEL